MSKYVVITGASGGLGRSLVKQFAKKGNYLLLLARNEAILKQLQLEYANYCDGIDYYVFDFSNTSDYDTIVKWINNRVDIIIHNAGYGLYVKAEQFSENDIMQMFHVNVFAPLQLTTKLLPILYEKGSGSIVFIASQASKLVTPKSALYSSTKFALRGYANGLRVEAKPNGVHVMVVNPGPIDTNFFSVADKSGEYSKAVSRMMLSSDNVAKQVLHGIEQQKREINLPRWMELGSKLSVWFPRLSDKIIARFGDKK